MVNWGGSYPPGCSGVPADDVPDMHPLSEQLCELLEGLGVDQEVTDGFTKGIDELAAQAEMECARCEDAALREAALGDAESVIMPARLTAENGAKAALSGEFSFAVRNPMWCDCGEGSENCDRCQLAEELGELPTMEVVVPWSVIKQIYARAVEVCGAPVPPAISHLPAVP